MAKYPTNNRRPNWDPTNFQQATYLILLSYESAWGSRAVESGFGTDDLPLNQARMMGAMGMGMGGDIQMNMPMTLAMEMNMPTGFAFPSHPGFPAAGWGIRTLNPQQFMIPSPPDPSFYASHQQAMMIANKPYSTRNFWGNRDTSTRSKGQEKNKKPTTLKITRQDRVDTIEYISHVPPTFDVPRNPTAFLLDLFSTPELLTNRLGKTIPIDKFIRSENQESWDGPVATRCRKVDLKCNGIDVCQYLDKILFAGCERYEADEEEMHFTIESATPNAKFRVMESQFLYATLRILRHTGMNTSSAARSLLFQAIDELAAYTVKYIVLSTENHYALMRLSDDCQLYMSRVYPIRNSATQAQDMAELVLLYAHTALDRTPWPTPERSAVQVLRVTVPPVLVSSPIFEPRQGIIQIGDLVRSVKLSDLKHPSGKFLRWASFAVAKATYGRFALDRLAREFDVYNALRSLQGIAIPILFALYLNENDGSSVLIISHGGTPLQDFDTLTPADRHALMSHLIRIHRAGVQHNDVESRNVFLSPSKDPVIIDFDNASLHHHCTGQYCDELPKLAYCLGLNLDAELEATKHDTERSMDSLALMLICVVFLFARACGETIILIPSPNSHSDFVPRLTGACCSFGHIGPVLLWLENLCYFEEVFNSVILPAMICSEQYTRTKGRSAK
ncbi:hypothetical protein R3P38DRAFT_2816049 [Favolaschia claudopus]|uniref:Protein kinase domain-containing protein n=1 Tax=Favolaschia claudopus TaxID=2862362 RepID=A0AAV9YZU1_9AGAR